MVAACVISVFDLGELVDRERADAVVRGSLVGPEELGDLVEREPDMLGEVDDRETPHDVRAVAAHP